MATYRHRDCPTDCVRATSRRAQATTPLIVPPSDHGSRTPSGRKYVNRIAEVASRAAYRATNKIRVCGEHQDCGGHRYRSFHRPCLAALMKQPNNAPDFHTTRSRPHMAQTGGQPPSDRTACTSNAPPKDGGPLGSGEFALAARCRVQGQSVALSQRPWRQEHSRYPPLCSRSHP